MSYSEPIEKIKPESLDLMRARRSLRGELEAIDWYQERIDATGDESLRKIPRAQPRRGGARGDADGVDPPARPGTGQDV